MKHGSFISTNSITISFYTLANISITTSIAKHTSHYHTHITILSTSVVTYTPHVPRAHVHSLTSAHPRAPIPTEIIVRMAKKKLANCPLRMPPLSEPNLHLICCLVEILCIAPQWKTLSHEDTSEDCA